MINLSDLLTKEKILFDRDEKGELLPQTVEIKISKTVSKIKITPITRGKWLKLLTLTSEEQDMTVVLDHLTEPKVTKEEYMLMKPAIAQAIVKKIINVSMGKDDEEQPQEQTVSEVGEAEEYVLKKKF